MNEGIEVRSSSHSEGSELFILVVVKLRHKQLKISQASFIVYDSGCEITVIDEYRECNLLSSKWKVVYVPREKKRLTPGE